MKRRQYLMDRRECEMRHDMPRYGKGRDKEQMVKEGPTRIESF